MIPHFWEWVVLCIIAIIACALALAAIHWVMDGYGYDSDEDWWDELE